jgi:hypothetical protein
MLATELASIVENYAKRKGGFSKIDSGKAKVLKDMMSDFNTLIATGLPANVIFESMKMSLQSAAVMQHEKDTKTLGKKIMGKTMGKMIKKEFEGASDIVSQLLRLATYCGANDLMKKIKNEEIAEEKVVATPRRMSGPG